MKVAGSLILSLMLAATVCAWKPAKDIVRTDNSQQFDYTAYTDSTSGSTHAVYCNVTDKNIHYIHVDSNGVAEAPVVLSTGQLCWNGADVIGIHDGNRIYAVYSGVRSKDGIL